MSGIYISDMEMPKEGFVEILIRDDGTVQQTGQSYRVDGTDYYTPYVGEMPVIYKAIPVPEHGDLIERNTLSKSIKKETINQAEFYADRMNPVVLAYGDCYSKVQDAPTIIPADLPVMYYPQVPGITPTVISDTEEDV